MAVWVSAPLRLADTEVFDISPNELIKIVWNACQYLHRLLFHSPVPPNINSFNSINSSLLGGSQVVGGGCKGDIQRNRHEALAERLLSAAQSMPPPAPCSGFRPRRRRPPRPRSRNPEGWSPQIRLLGIWLDWPGEFVLCGTLDGVSPAAKVVVRFVGKQREGIIGKTVECDTQTEVIKR